MKHCGLRYSQCRGNSQYGRPEELHPNSQPHSQSSPACNSQASSIHMEAVSWSMWFCSPSLELVHPISSAFKSINSPSFHLQQTKTITIALQPWKTVDWLHELIASKLKIWEPLHMFYRLNAPKENISLLIFCYCSINKQCILYKETQHSSTLVAVYNNLVPSTRVLIKGLLTTYSAFSFYLVNYGFKYKHFPQIGFVQQLLSIQPRSTKVAHFQKRKCQIQKTN